MSNSCSAFNDNDLQELKAIAQLYIGADSLFMRLVNRAGAATQNALEKLPEDWRSKISEASGLALKAAYDVARNSQASHDSDSWLNSTLSWAQGETWHKVATSITGALGGVGGLATTVVDLPVTTTLILRSIQQIAKGYGENVSVPEVRAQCIAVFALGGPLKEDDDKDAGLWAIRLSVTGQAVAGIIKAAAPRFGIVVGEKFLAQATPFLGAIAGGTINPLFTQYYQTMAHCHFRLRRIERSHDPDRVRSCFERIVRALRDESTAAAVA